jgi:ABC-type uncharacterized transport system auxiliary subunit
VSVLPEQVVPDGLYRLSSATLKTAASDVSLPADMLITEPDGSTLLLGKAIIYEQPSGALTLLSKAQWGDVASRMMQGLLLDRLAVPGPDSKGRVVSDQLATIAPLELHWRMRDFVVQGERASVALRVTLVSARRRELISQFDIAREVAFNGKPEVAGVEALIEASRLAVNDIALQLPEALSGYDPKTDK